MSFWHVADWMADHPADAFLLGWGLFSVGIGGGLIALMRLTRDEKWTKDHANDR